MAALGDMLERFSWREPFVAFGLLGAAWALAW